MGEFTLQEEIAGSINVAIAFFSLLGTLTTLYLIYDLKKRNSYVLLIFSMTFCQALYDILFFFIPFYDIPICKGLSVFLSIFSGIAVTLWTNVISTVVLYIVQYLRSFNIIPCYRLIFTLVMAPSITLGVLSVVYIPYDRQYNLINVIYYWVRVGSICYNLLVHGLITLKLYRMGFFSLDSFCFGNKRKLTKFSARHGRSDDPVYVLSSRLKYYPIVQIITRSGAAWYEYVYGFRVSAFADSNTPLGFSSLLLFAVASPAAGLGFFLVFLLVQPDAYQRLRLRCSQMCGTRAGTGTNETPANDASAGVTSSRVSVLRAHPHGCSTEGEGDKGRKEGSSLKCEGQIGVSSPMHQQQTLATTTATATAGGTACGAGAGGARLERTGSQFSWTSWRSWTGGIESGGGRIKSSGWTTNPLGNNSSSDGKEPRIEGEGGGRGGVEGGAGAEMPREGSILRRLSSWMSPVDGGGTRDGWGQNASGGDFADEGGGAVRLRSNRSCYEMDEDQLAQEILDKYHPTRRRIDSAADHHQY